MSRLLGTPNKLRRELLAHLQLLLYPLSAVNLSAPLAPLTTFFRSSLLYQLLIALSLLSLGSNGFAQNHASRGDAVKMVKKAVAYYKKHGVEKAALAFSDQKGAFRNHELFVVLMDERGNVLGHGGIKKLLGANIMNLQDSDGIFMVKDMYSKAKKNGDSGWSVPYKWLNPDVNKMEMKVTYFERIDNKIIFCGVYSS